MILEALFARSLEDGEIINALVKLIPVCSKAIEIVEDICRIDFQVSDRTKILCESHVDRDFILRLSLYLRSPQLKNQNYYEPCFWSKFCYFLQCRCLISDRSYNPCSWILVKGLNEYQNVYLVPSYLDREQYVIERELN